MANNERNTSSKKEGHEDPENTSTTAEDAEDRYQNQEQSPAEKNDEGSKRDDERYMRRSRSRDDRRGGMWGYKSWDIPKAETDPDRQDPVKDQENDRGLSKGSDPENGPIGMGKRQEDEQEESN